MLKTATYVSNGNISSLRRRAPNPSQRIMRMGILLAFAPFIAFAVVDRLLGSAEGLFAGFAVSAILLMRDWLSRLRRPKTLEIGTAVLFGGLAMYTLIGSPAWSIVGVRLVVDAGLLLIVITSIAVRQPFTLQYAREQVAQEVWTSQEFIRTNYVISTVWALAFVALVAADLVLLYAPGLPPRFGIILMVLALVGAVKFTAWYPDHRRSTAETATR